ncbi:hypothetical protein BC938DRAFT_472708, partial [Jimgerdemannia flammicorona]
KRNKASDFINLIQYYHAHSPVDRALDNSSRSNVERHIGQPALNPPHGLILEKIEAGACIRYAD